VRAKEWEVMLMAVEAGVRGGCRRAWKHVDGPEPDDSQVEVIADYVMNSISEWFDFPVNEE